MYIQHCELNNWHCLYCLINNYRIKMTMNGSTTAATSLFWHLRFVGVVAVFFTDNSWRVQVELNALI